MVELWWLCFFETAKGVKRFLDRINRILQDLRIWNLGMGNLGIGNLGCVICGFRIFQFLI